MSHHNPPVTAMPVRAATFPDGPDSVLLNPDIPRARWRGERVHAGLRHRFVLTGLAGAALAPLTAVSCSGFAAVFFLGAGILALGMSLLAGWCSAAGMLTDHRHPADSPCRLDRVRGEFFFRSRDFTDLGTASYAVRTLIAGVDELHRSPARAWIDPAVPRRCIGWCGRRCAAWTAPAPPGAWPTNSPPIPIPRLANWLPRPARRSP